MMREKGGFDDDDDVKVAGYTLGGPKKKGAVGR